MRKTKLVLLAVLAATAMMGCKKGGGYIQTAPAPAIAR